MNPRLSNASAPPRSPTRDAQGVRRRRGRGFTLVEAISTMVIIGTVATVAAGIIWRGSEAYQSAATDTELYGELTAAMDRIERALREVPGKGGGKANLSGVTPSSVSWASGTTACALALSGGQLILTTDSSGPMVLATGAVSLSVQAYDESNAALGGTLSGSALDSVRRLSVSATLSRGDRSATLRTRVFLRCCSEGVN